METCVGFMTMGGDGRIYTSPTNQPSSITSQFKK